MLEPSLLREFNTIYLVHLILFIVFLFDLILQIMISVVYIEIYWFNIFFYFYFHICINFILAWGLIFPMQFLFGKPSFSIRVL
jgi:hypothetical protein